MTSDTYLNASEAAKQTGKSLVTIRHYLSSGKFPNATQTAKGKVQVWRIPLTDLVSAGLMDKVSNSSKQPSETELKENKETALNNEIDRLERELESTREALRVANERIAELREDKAKLFARLPLALETKQAQDQRRFSWFRRNT
jgi:DNA-binding transcriptional MerR regulator